MDIIDYIKTYFKGRTDPAPQQTQGVTGTETYGGYINEEFQDRLRDTRNRYEIYHRMRSESGVIAMCTKSTRDSIQSSKWGFAIKPEYEGDPEAQAQLEFMKKAFSSDDMERLVEDMTTAVIFGFYLGERYYKPFSYNGKTMLRPKVKFISQRTIDQWATNDESELTGVIQRAYGDDVIIKNDARADKGIDGRNLIHYAVNQEGDNHEGISFLRACYMSWLRKNQYYRQIAIGTRFLALPYLKVMQDPSLAGGTPSDEDMRLLGDILKNRANKDRVVSHIMLPLGFRAEEQQTSFNPETLYRCNDAEDQEMIRAFCANFLLLTKGSGSFALSNDLSSFFMRGLEAVASGMDRSIDRGLVAPAIYVNFDQECKIECVHSEVGGKGGPQLAEAMAKLLGSRIVKPDETLERWVREKFGMPEIDFETRDESSPMQAMPGIDPAFADRSEPEEPEEQETTSSETSAQTWATPSGLKAQAKRSVSRLKSTQKTLQSEYQKGLQGVIDKKMKKISSFLKKTDPDKAMGKFKTSILDVSTTSLKKQVVKVIEDAFASEYKDVSGRLEMATRRELRVMLQQRSFSDVDSIVEKLDTTLVSVLYDALRAGDTDAAISIIRGQATSFVSSSAVIAKATVLPALAINEARRYGFDEVRDEIESYTYYNESPVTEICKYLTGKTISVNDPDQIAYQPPLHYNCATVVFPNMKSFRDNPNPQQLTPNKTQLKDIQIGPKAVIR